MNLRDFARGQTCTARIPGVCNQDPETVVLAHCNMFGMGGMGMKAPDLCAAHVCSDCHDVLDGRTNRQDWDEHWDPDVRVAKLEIWLGAILRTLERVSKDFVILHEDDCF